MVQHAVEVKDVKKSFYLPNHKNDSIKRTITQAFKKKDKGGDTFNALNGISFNVEKGDFFGILGRNGSGKSTLLKIISEIYQPTTGMVKHHGKVVSFIELGVGFKTELSGRENVFLNGALLGFSKREVEAMYDDIVEFAELEEFMDQKLKNYSSGMKVRLAFSVAIRAKADILILDEVLAVGDAAFQKKCTDYFKTLKDDGKTVILVTHSMSHVRDYCNKAIVIEGGKIIYEGNANVAADTYLQLFGNTNVDGDFHANDKFRASSVEVNYSEDNINLDIAITPKQDIEDPVIAVLINQSGKLIYRWVSDENTDTKIKLTGEDEFKASLNIQNIFPVGKCTVDLLIRRADRSVDYGIYSNIAEFEVVNHSAFKHKRLWRPNEKFTTKKVK